MKKPRIPSLALAAVLALTAASQLSAAGPVVGFQEVLDTYLEETPEAIGAAAAIEALDGGFSPTLPAG